MAKRMQVGRLGSAGLRLRRSSYRFLISFSAWLTIAPDLIQDTNSNSKHMQNPSIDLGAHGSGSSWVVDRNSMKRKDRSIWTAD